MHNAVMGVAPVRSRAAGRRFPTLVGLLACIGLAIPLSAQRVAQRQVETPVDFKTSQDDNLFSLLRSQDHIHEFEEALRELAADDSKAAVSRLHALLQIENGGVVPVGPRRFVGLRLAVILTLANLPEKARAEYDRLVEAEGGTADGLLVLPPDQLLRTAERFPASTLGQRARVRLGDLALVDGDGLSAQGHFRLALDGAPIGSAEEKRIAERLHCASVLHDADSARAAAMAGVPAPIDDDVLQVVVDGGEPRRHGALGGGGSGRTPMANIAGRPDSRYSPPVMAPGFGMRDIGNFAMYPVGDLDGIYVNTGREVIAYDPLRSDIAWTSITPMQDDRNDHYNDAGDGINQDMALAAACDADVVVAALQVPERSKTVDFQGSLRVMSKMPLRRLFAFSRQSGKVLWSHFDQLDGPRTRAFRGHEACANPLIAGDVVYAPVHDRAGAIAFSVGAYDLRTGKQKWRRLVCSSQQDVNMFGNARTEFAASPLALSDGLLLGTSNLGVAFALEAATGRVRWIASYDIVNIPRSNPHHHQDRHVFFANNAPVVVDGVVCMTPLDSQFVLAFDCEQGRQLWRLPAEATIAGTDNRVLWLCGALGVEFVLAGSGAIAVRARPDATARPRLRQLVRPEVLGDRRNSLLNGRPAVTANGVWFVRNDSLLGFDRSGEPLGDGEVRLNRLLPGNLLLVGGIAVSLRQTGLDIAFDKNALRAHVEARVAQSPDDPSALLRLASLHRALLPVVATAEATAAVQAIYRRGLEAALKKGLAKNHPVRTALQRELFEHALATAKAALQGSAPDTMARLEQARAVAPDAQRWIEVQLLVLARCAGDRQRFHQELDRLLAEVGDATWPLGDGVPVRTWVQWQRAATTESPAAAVLLWQELIERHPDLPLGDGNAHAVATAAIAALVKQHGAACYEPVQARAIAALAAAGNDRIALEALVRTFPNSKTADEARVKLLDLAVASGDLAVVCTMLASTGSGGEVPPGVLRRVMVTAQKSGNLALARAMARQLEPHQNLTSDWQEDAGGTYGDGLRRTTLPADQVPPLVVPEAKLAHVPPRSTGEAMSLLTTMQPAGFARMDNAPVYVRSGAELVALDMLAPSADAAVLFALPIDYVQHVVVCSHVLVVPDMERVFAVDHRSGARLWELPNERNRQIESLGVQSGVLLLWRQPNTLEGSAELLGVEPLTGVRLFALTFPGNSLKPKAIEGALLHLDLAADGTATLRTLDAVTGRTRRITSIDRALLRTHVGIEPDSLSARLFPQWLVSDGERVFLPVEGSLSGEAPRLCAIDANGKLAWHWRGSQGGQLLLAACHGGHFVFAEGGDRGPARLVVLNAKDGSRVREVDIGRDAAILNWEPSWLANPAPDRIAIESFADGDRTQRQFVCCTLAGDGATFAVTLGPEDGEIVQEPLFGADFVSFGARLNQGRTGLRLWTLALADRSGRLSEGRKYQVLELTGTTDGMQAHGSETLISAQGLHLMGKTRGNR